VQSQKKEENSLFISYAWGGSIEKKEWLRDKAIGVLSSYFQTFWDRDSIQYGYSIDDVVWRALAARPLTVFCFCDQDYCHAARKEGAGLWRELAMLEKIAQDVEVRIVPLLLDTCCVDLLPPLLIGRSYLDLTQLVSRSVHLANILSLVVLGATQAEVTQYIASELRISDLRDRADAYFSHYPIKICGNARTHRVSLNTGLPLLPPDWMRVKPEWSNVVADDDDDFSPMNGIWHWDHWSPSLGMRALGTAVCAAFFPGRTTENEVVAIESAGKILAVDEFSKIKRTEPFVFSSHDLTRLLLSSPEGANALACLLP